MSSPPKDGVSSSPKDGVSSPPRDGVSSSPQDGASSSRDNASVTVPPARLRRLGADLLVAAGADPGDAQLVADHLVEANLAGHDSHGIGMLPQYVRAIRGGVLRPREHAVVEDRGGAVLSVDGRRGFGQVVAKEAIAAGIERARSFGVALVALRNASHVGRVGAYGEQAARAGLASVHFANVVGHPPLVAPYRGSDARFATNPVCVAVPGPDGSTAVLLDFATSVSALGKVRVAMNRGERMSPGVLIDSSGRPTDDPGVMFADPRGAILPFGLHKGFGLAFACELLAGAMTGGGTLSSVPFEADRIGNNMLSFLFDPARLPGAEGLHEEVARAVSYVKGSPPANPALPVLVAGDPERQARAEREARGVPVEVAAWDQLREAASSVGMEWDAARGGDGLENTCPDP